MTLFQILMLGASAFFAFKIYQHIQTLNDPEFEKKMKGGSSDKRGEESFERLLNEADEAFDRGDLQRALGLYIDAKTKGINDFDLLFKIGYIFEKLNRNDEAMNYYKEALEVDKDSEYAHNAIASLYRTNKEYVSAKMHLIASLEINSKNAITHYNYGNLLVEMQHFDEAKAMYKKAIEINPDFSEAKEELEKLESRVKNENIANI